MSSSPGTRVGAYEILASIGKGGMGEVFRAHDTRLGRDVAIKFSGEQFTDRFKREAQIVASLNHPNICTLHDVGPDYLVMELIEGETLADRIKQGAIPLEESLKIAQQTADALEAAHEKGITHRDLKPGNIKIRPDGTVKVLDFGLAKIGGTPTAHTEDSPTITMGATQAGVILGTAAYMSPEQAKGKPVDKRADIWAFGVVLHEMLTGTRLFEGETMSDILAAVIMKEPDLTSVPAKVRRLLQACLEKDPKKRLRDIGDISRLLDTPLESRSRNQPWPWIAAAGVAAIAALALWAPWRSTRPVEPPPSVRYQIAPSEKASLGAAFALSPDGHYLVFAAPGPDSQMYLWLQIMDSLESRMLPGTQHSANPAANPFWSPDSKFIAFLQDGKLRKLPVSGGPPRTIFDTDGDTGGGTWNRDGTILVGSASHGIFRVADAGGAPVPVTELDSSRKELFHRRPFFLPDGQHFLYVRGSSMPGNSGVYLRSLNDPPSQAGARLLDTQLSVGFVPFGDVSKGYLVFLREGALMAQVLDTERLKLVGEAQPVVDQVDFNGSTTGMFSVSFNGLLAYRSGSVDNSLLWLDRSGKVLESIDAGSGVEGLVLSPDETRAAATRFVGANRDIWLLDLGRKGLTRFTLDPNQDSIPVWSPDGHQIAFSSNRSGGGDLYRKSSNGSGADELLLSSSESKRPSDWSPDGRVLLFTRGVRPGTDLWTLSLEGERKASPFLTSSADEGQGKFSPDGRWVAYVSNETGSPEVYVRPFPAGSQDGKWMVSVGGGLQPSWRHDGRELFYLSPGGKIMAVGIQTTPDFKASAPQTLFTAPVTYRTTGAARLWSVSSDGKRFLMLSPTGGESGTPLTVVTNWTNLLNR